MKLRAMMNEGYTLRAWTMKCVRGEWRIAVKLGKTMKNGKEQFFVVHSPISDAILSEAEFTAPVPAAE